METFSIISMSHHAYYNSSSKLFIAQKKKVLLLHLSSSTLEIVRGFHDDFEWRGIFTFTLMGFYLLSREHGKKISNFSKSQRSQRAHQDEKQVTRSGKILESWNFWVLSSGKVENQQQKSFSSSSIGGLGKRRNEKINSMTWKTECVSFKEE